MGSRSRTRYVSPEFEHRVHAFLSEYDAGLTFMALRADPEQFEVMISDKRGAVGRTTDVDFEFALVVAEDAFLGAQPAHRLGAEEHALLQQALVPPAQREDEREEQQERLRRALMEPRAELEANRSESYGAWVGDVVNALTPPPYFDDIAPLYWRQLYQAGFSPREAATEAEGAWLQERGYAGNGQRPPPPPRVGHPRVRQPSALGHASRMVRSYDDKPFNPEAPREHYARPHHFAVNMDPDAALTRYWEAVDAGDIAEARDAKSDLMDWIERGGFEPDWEASGHSRAEFLALTGASMRSRHGSPHGRASSTRR